MSLTTLCLNIQENSRIIREETHGVSITKAMFPLLLIMWPILYFLIYRNNQSCHTLSSRLFSFLIYVKVFYVFNYEFHIFNKCACILWNYKTLCKYKISKSTHSLRHWDFSQIIGLKYLGHLFSKYLLSKSTVLDTEKKKQWIRTIWFYTQMVSF